MEFVIFWKIQEIKDRSDHPTRFIFTRDKSVADSYRNFKYDVYEMQGIKIEDKIYSLVYEFSLPL